jgi:gliding motility-associated-like protein
VWPVFSAADHCLRQQLSISAKVRGNGKPQNYNWKFGDGNTATGAAINHTYAADSTYGINLSVQTDKGCLRDTTVMVRVLPLPQIRLNTSNPCKDDSVIFTDLSFIKTGILGTSDWHFSNGSKAKGGKIWQKFAVPGNYTVTLVRTSNFNCTDSASLPFVVYPPVRVKYSATNVCEEETTHFYDSTFSVNPISFYSWSFGDGKSSVLQNPTKKYAVPGTYKTSLMVTTLPGCNYFSSGQNTVYPKPDARFVHSPNQGTIIDPNIAFTDASKLADSLWYTTSIGYKTSNRNFTFAFPDSGKFIINQYVKTRYGCMDSFSNSVYINFMYTLHVPTAFTPNGDGKNEGFAPLGMGIQWYDMKIFNRWGQKLYETDNSRPWDGTYNGELVPEGVYVVIIQLRDYRMRLHYYKGSVHLLHLK